MTVEVFLILFAVFATITSLMTEGIKKWLDSLKVQYASNIVVLVAAILVGGIGTIVYYLIFDYAWTTLNIICIFLMICANWLGAMIGYDKVTQAITQLAQLKNKQE